MNMAVPVSLYEMILSGNAAILLGFLLDLLFGDPAGRFHPVCMIGKLISILEKCLLRVEDGPRKKVLKGSVLVMLVLLITGAVTAALLYAAFRIRLMTGILLAALISDSTLAMRDLKKESMRVYTALGEKEDALEKGRSAVSRIVGRDTSVLDEKGVLRAAVETVAENTTDGVVAPLFYLMLGGPVMAMLYKAVNTMDSMLGYKNEKYLYFGRAAARLDDVANFIPSRVAAFLWCIAALPAGEDAAGAFRIWRRDHGKHESPNSAQTESACAGALGIRLAGDAQYFGKIKKKPYIGDPLREIGREDIVRADRMMYITACLALAAGMLLRWGLLILLYRNGWR